MLASRYGHLPGFADGGVATGESAEEKKRRQKAEEYAKDIRGANRGFGFGNDPTAASTRAEIKAFAADVRDAGGQLGKAFDHLGKRAVTLSKRYEQEDRAREKAQQYRSEIRGQAKDSFNNDIFGGGLSDLQLQLSADTNDSQDMKKALAKAGRRGLDGDFAAQLAGSGNLLLAQEISTLSKKEIRQLERQYIGRGTAQAGLGQQAVDMSGVQQEIASHTKELSEIRKSFKGIEKKMENGVRRGAREGVEGKDKQRSRRVANRSRLTPR